jgi:hypothetical protein
MYFASSFVDRQICFCNNYALCALQHCLCKNMKRNIEVEWSREKRVSFYLNKTIAVVEKCNINAPLHWSSLEASVVVTILLCSVLNYTYMDALFQFCWIPFSYFQNFYIILVVWIIICVIFILVFAFDGEILVVANGYVYS